MSVRKPMDDPKSTPTMIPGAAPREFGLAVPNAPAGSAMAWSWSPKAKGNITTANFSDSFARRLELETAFYEDLTCCDKGIPDLHHLLRHYEDCHLLLPQQQDEDEVLAAATTTITTTIGSGDDMSPIIPGIFDDFGPRPVDDDGWASSHRLTAMDGPKPYRCSVPGCSKSYKNPNGLKYHREHGHLLQSNQDDQDRPFRCILCPDKRYRQIGGLKYHLAHAH